MPAFCVVWLVLFFANLYSNKAKQSKTKYYPPGPAFFGVFFLFFFVFFVFFVFFLVFVCFFLFFYFSLMFFCFFCCSKNAQAVGDWELNPAPFGTPGPPEKKH